MNELAEVKQDDETDNRTIDTVSTISSAVDSTISTVHPIVDTVAKTISTVAICKARIVETKAKRDVSMKKLSNEEKALHNELKKINIIGDAIDRNFEERAKVIDKAGTVIDKGLETNDLNTVELGLGCMASVVTKSPLKDLNILGSPIIDNQLEVDDDSIIDI